MHSDDGSHVAASDRFRTKTSLIRAVGGPEGGTRWDEFDEIYRPLMLALARKAGLTHHDSQDVVQNALVTLVRGASRFELGERPGSFRAYLKKVIESRMWDLFRAKRRQPANPEKVGTSSENEAALAAVPVSIEVSEAEFGAVLERAMRSLAKKLDPQEIQLLDLYYCKEWPAKRVAASLNLTVANVQQIAKRKKDLLLREVKRQREDPHP